MAGCINMALGTEIGLSPGNFVLGTQAPPLPYLRSMPLNPATGLGRAVSSPSGVWGFAPAEIEIWCILALKSDIWW